MHRPVPQLPGDSKRSSHPRRNRPVSCRSRVRRSLECLESRVLPAGVVISASTFDVDQFEQNIIGFLDGNVVGYAYAINQNGSLAAHGADGDARTPIDGQDDFETSTRIEVASVSKTITAVALLKLLEDQNVSVDTKIWPYLPTAWQADMGNYITEISFADLLKQRSGIRSNAISYNGLAGVIAAGVDEADYGVFEYRNPNYALLRVVIPYLWDAVPTTDLEGPGVDGSAATGAWYKTYLQDHIFAPMGINGAEMAPTGNNPALSYLFPHNNQPGLLWDDFTETGGANGWYLSADDLAVFLDRIDGDDAILSPSTIDLMRTEFLGLHDPLDWDSFGDGWFGTYYGHGGDNHDGPTTGEVHTTFYTFPGGIQAAVIMNSGHGFPGHQNDALEAAYENAWSDLVVEGTSAADTFDIRTAGADVLVRLNGNAVVRHRGDTLNSLTINGLGGADTFIIGNLPASTLNLTINGNSGGDTVQVNALLAGGAINVNTGGGNDTVELSPQFQDLDSIGGVIHVDMGSGSWDEIIIHDHDAGHDTYNLWADHFDSSGFGHLYFDNAERIDLRAGDGDNRINVRGLDENVRLMVRARGGNDEIVVGHGTNDLDTFIRGDITVQGGSGIDILRLHDGGDNFGNDSYTFSVNRFTKTGIDTWDYIQIEEVVLAASSFDNTIHVNSLVPVDLSINAWLGNDTIHIGSGRADLVRGNVHVNGSLGTDVIHIHDQNSPGARTYTLAGQGFDMSSVFFGGLSYTSISSVILDAGDHGDTIHVESSVLGTHITANGNGGDDTFHIGNGDLDAVGGDVTAHGGFGADTLVVHDETDVGHDDYSITATTVAKQNFLLDYFVMESLVLHANAGNNTIDVHSTSAQTPATIYAGPGGDTIRLSPVGQNLGWLPAAVHVHGEAGVDNVIADDRLNPLGGLHPYTLTATTLDRDFFGGLVFGTIERLLAEFGTGDDIVNVMEFNPDVYFYLEGNRGSDTFNVSVRPADAGPSGGHLFVNGDEPERGGRSGDRLNIFYMPDPAIHHAVSPTDPSSGRIRLEYLDALFAIRYGGIEELTFAEL